MQNPTTGNTFLNNGYVPSSHK